MKRNLGFLTLVFTAGCVHVPPREAPVAREVVVESSFDRTWSAAVAAFGERGLVITTNDRGSGLLEVERDSLPRTKENFADCGRAIGVTLFPTRAKFSVRIRGDTSHTVMTVMTKWLFGRSTSAKAIICASTGLWETDFSALVKKQAEANP